MIQSYFEHPNGVLYFELFWEEDPEYGIHLIEGEIEGDGPWRVGESTFHIMGCNHTDPKLCEIQSFHRQEFLLKPEQFRMNEVLKIASEKGAILPKEVAINDQKKT